MADFVTDFFKKQQSPTGPISTQGDAFGTPNYGGSPYSLPYQRGTNLPWSVQKDEPLPTWNGSRPVDATGQRTVNPGAVPIYTGVPGSYGGSTSNWFDPTTGKVTDQYGHITDSQLSGGGPDQWQALAALAAGNPGGMLTTADFGNAAHGIYGDPAPGGTLPKTNNYNVPVSDHELARRYNQTRAARMPNWDRLLRDPRQVAWAQQNGVTLGSSAVPSMQASYSLGGNPTIAQLEQSGLIDRIPGSSGSLQPVAGAGSVAQTSAGGLGTALPQLLQLFQSLLSGVSQSAGGSSTIDLQKLQQILQALGAQ